MGGKEDAEGEYDNAFLGDAIGCLGGKQDVEAEYDNPFLGDAIASLRMNEDVEALCDNVKGEDALEITAEAGAPNEALSDGTTTRGDAALSDGTSTRGGEALSDGATTRVGEALSDGATKEFACKRGRTGCGFPKSTAGTFSHLLRLVMLSTESAYALAICTALRV